MARFAYTARDRSGKSVSSELEAPARKDALRLLATRGLQVASVTEIAGARAAKKSAPTAKPAAPDPAAAPARATFSSGSKVPTRKECLPFLESLYDLATSGLSAGEAVRLLSVRI